VALAGAAVGNLRAGAGAVQGIPTQRLRTVRRRRRKPVSECAAGEPTGLVPAGRRGPWAEHSSLAVLGACIALGRQGQLMWLSRLSLTGHVRSAQLAVRWFGGQTAIQPSLHPLQSWRGMFPLSYWLHSSLGWRGAARE